MEKLRSSGSFNTFDTLEPLYNERRPRRTPAQAAAAVNNAQARLADLEAQRAVWMTDGQTRLAELMDDNVARMAAMRQGRQITHDIAARQAQLQEALPEAQPFYQQVGHLVLDVMGI